LRDFGEICGESEREAQPGVAVAKIRRSSVVRRQIDRATSTKEGGANTFKYESISLAVSERID
jgi:hypothetical protein